MKINIVKIKKVGQVLSTVAITVLPLLPAKPIVICLQALLLLRKKV